MQVGLSTILHVPAGTCTSSITTKRNIILPRDLNHFNPVQAWRRRRTGTPTDGCACTYLQGCVPPLCRPPALRSTSSSTYAGGVDVASPQDRSYTMHRPLPFSILFGISIGLATAFSVNYGDPSQCDDFKVSWSGGNAPFSLVLVPLYGTPRNVSIPASAYDGSSGSFSTQIPFAENSQMQAVMYDSSGVLSGSLTQVKLVGGNTNGQSCNVTDPHPYFTYAWPDGQSPVQCQPFEFFAYDNATLPITLTILPAGQDPQVVQSNTTQQRFDWIAEIAAGTSVVFMMTDAQGHQGGASGLQVIQPSSNYTCLIYPTTSSSSTNPTSTSPSNKSGQNNGDEEHTISVGTIAGIAVGGAVVALLAAGAAFCLWRRCRPRRSRVAVLDLKERPMVDMDFHRPSREDYHVVSPFTALPLSDAAYLAGRPSHSQQSTSEWSSGKSAGYPPSHTPLRSSNASLFSPAPGGASSSTRVVVHQDYADADPAEVVELPPAYREDREPIPGLPAPNPPPVGSGSSGSGKRR